MCQIATLETDILSTQQKLCKYQCRKRQSDHNTNCPIYATTVHSQYNDQQRNACGNRSIEPSNILERRLTAYVGQCKPPATAGGSDTLQNPRWMLHELRDGNMLLSEILLFDVILLIMSSRYHVDKWNKPHAPNPAMLRHELEKEGFRVMHWRDSPGASYGMHKHAEEQSHWVISGKMEITVGNLFFELSAGDRDHMPAETYHTARVVGDEPVVYLIGEKISGRDKASDAEQTEGLIENMMMMEKMQASFDEDGERIEKEKP